jgi:8-oxo-dGTP diphosphatase
MRSVAGISLRGVSVFVARRKPGGSMGGRWEFPGGKLEAGESYRDAVIREFREEFELEIVVGQAIGDSSFQNDGRRYELTAVLVDFDGEPGTLHEHDQYRWVAGEALGELDLADSDRSLLPFILPLLVPA